MPTLLQALPELTIKQWLFVKITDSEGHVGWGESSLEGGYTTAVQLRTNMLTRVQYVIIVMPLQHEPPSSSKLYRLQFKHL